MDLFSDLFTMDFMPHGHCYFWRPEILWLHVVSDLIIGLSYYSIPVALIIFVRKRTDLVFNWIFLLFAAFIFACGTTHFVAIWTVWHGAYLLEGAVKLITALVSFPTALLLWGLIPKALKVTSLAELQRELTAHSHVEATLRIAQAELERQVNERTRALKMSNAELEEKTRVLERFHNVTVDREMEMIQLKSEVNQLLKENGKPPKYSEQSAQDGNLISIENIDDE